MGLPVFPIWSWEVRTIRILGAMMYAGDVFFFFGCRRVLKEWFELSELKYDQ